MHPPDWVLVGARRLSSEEFSTEFVTAWSHIGSSFLKLECWQAYEEAEANLSQEAYRRGDAAAARDLLKQEAESDRPLYDDVQQRGIEYARVRLVKEPLSSYLEYEFVSYEIRVALGENVEVVRIGGDEQLPSAEYFDFLLFDQHTAIIHDYGTGSVGRQTGGWITHEAQVVAALQQKGAELRRHSTPFRQYLAGRRP